jgi:branched-chain amino acid aminotransferase
MINQYLFYNGRWVKNETPLITADNRGFRYGDGLFETMRMEDGVILLERLHFERLFAGLQLLQFELPAHFTPAYLSKQVAELCQKNKQATARVRLTVFRGNGGLYDAENHFPNCIIQSWALEKKNRRLNENGLVTGIYRAAKKSIDTFSSIKSNSYLPYLMAALYAKKQRWNDALLLNSLDHICDATIANIFVVKNKILYTPALSEGCIAGVMRNFLLENLRGQGYMIREDILTVDDIASADEMFLTNAIYRIRWVQNCGEKKYVNGFTTMVYNDIFKKTN